MSMHTKKGSNFYFIYMRVGFIFVLSFLVLQGCSIHGVYTTNPKNQAAFAGTEIVLTKNNTFHLKRWTDSYTVRLDLLDDRIWEDIKYKGYGTYVKKKDSLALTFLSEDSISIYISRKDSLKESIFQLSILGENGKWMKPFVTLKNSALQNIRNVFDQQSNTVEFRISNPSQVSIIGFDMLRIEAPQIFIELNEIKQGDNLLKFKTFNGFYGRNEVFTVYSKRSCFGLRFGDQKRFLPKRHQWKWLNRFY